MLGLILKILRGVYPPIPTYYSNDLRNLIAEMLQKNPRLRPSINQILKKPYIQKRIENFLSNSLIEDEFSHTILHSSPAPSNPVSKVSSPRGDKDRERGEKIINDLRARRQQEQKEREKRAAEEKKSAEDRPEVDALRKQKEAKEQEIAALLKIQKDSERKVAEDRKRRESIEKKVCILTYS
jgi:serine/threonine protein kinase